MRSDMREAAPESEIVPLPEEADWLGFEGTIPRALVHKQAVSEVLVTDSRALDEDTVLCAAELPTLHSLHGPRGGYHELLAIAEATRQAAELLAHRHLDVPHGQRFIFRQIDLRALEREALRAAASPARLILRMQVANRQELAGSLAAFDLAGTLHLDRRPAALGHGSCIFVPPGDYAALRPGSTDPPPTPSPPANASAAPRANPALVGREPRDVVLEPPRQRREETEAHLVVDEGHPSFFDHPHDHVPGPLLLEAMRQLALARACALCSTDASGWLLTRCATSFERFADLDRPVLLTASGEEREEGFEFTLRAEQGDPVAHGAMAVERV